MRNRVPSPGKEGRMLITPENGSAPFYATVTMADEPLDEGSPFAKETLLTDETEVLLWGSAADRSPDEALRRLMEIDVRVARGSYVGTFGANISDEERAEEVDLGLSFEPDIVIISPSNECFFESEGAHMQQILLPYGFATVLQQGGKIAYEEKENSYYSLSVSLTGGNLVFYAKVSAMAALPEGYLCSALNVSGVQYSWVAIKLSERSAE